MQNKSVIWIMSAIHIELQKHFIFNFHMQAEEKMFTWRRAKAEQALSIEEGFRNIATNLPISAALKNRNTKNSEQDQQ